MALHFPWPEPPEPARTLTVAPGVHWLRMPLPFQLDHINLWLLDDGEGWTVVDTGAGLEPTRALWEQAFASVLAGRPITRVVVTHFHPDHMGNAGWLTERWAAELWCTEPEWFAAQYVWRTAREVADMAPRLAHYRRHGLDEEGLGRMGRRAGHYPGLVPTLAPRFHPVRDGDTLTIGGRAWHAMTVYGHAPALLCLWSPDARVLVSSDQVLPKITTNVSVWPEQPQANPLRLYLDSLARFWPLAADALVLPSHGRPFRGLHARLDQLREHHEQRLGEALDALVEPRTATDLLPVLFRRKLDTHQLFFAIGEALAHLNFLEAQGSAVRMAGTDGIDRFQKA